MTTVPKGEGPSVAFGGNIVPFSKAGKVGQTKKQIVITKI